MTAESNRSTLLKAIDDAYIASEQGYVNEAIEVLRPIKIAAGEQNDFELAGKASALLVLCYKHKYQDTGDHSHLLLMESEVLHGLGLAITDEQKAVFWLRRGDIEFERGNFEAAERFCQKACDLSTKGSATEVEHLGHLAEFKSMNGKFSEADELFQKTVRLTKDLTGIRPFHRVTLESGIWARRTRWALLQKRHLLAFWYFLHGYQLAWSLKLSYGMPHRLRQFHRAIRETMCSGV